MDKRSFRGTTVAAERTTAAAERTTVAAERLLFPAWSGPDSRRSGMGGKRVFRIVVGVGFVLLALFVVVAFGILARGARTDQVLGRTLEVRDVNLLGLPAAAATRRDSAFGRANPWRGAGNRRRVDLLSSVSGCGGKYRRRLQNGDTASLYYFVREGKGSVVDATSRGHQVDVVLGSGQVSAEMEKRLEGMCSGETVAFQSTGRSFVVHVGRVGRRLPEDEIAHRLERLAHEVKSVRAGKGIACQLACRRKGMRCVEDGFRIINSCPRLREAFACRSCETAAAGTSGPDMPCYVELSAPPGHPRGFCMVNPNVETATCNARYGHTRRLCPCVTQKEDQLLNT